MINEEIENQINNYNKEMQKAVSHVEIALDLWEETIEDDSILKKAADFIKMFKKPRSS